MMGFYVAEHGDDRAITDFTIDPGASAKFWLRGVPQGACLTLCTNNPTRLTMSLVNQHASGGIHLLEWEAGASDTPTDGLEAAMFDEYQVKLNATKAPEVAAAPTVITARARLPGWPSQNVEMWVTTDHTLTTRLIDLARKQLNIDLPKSITERREYGGVIYRYSRTGVIEQTGPFQGPIGAGTVNIRHKEPNMGCPKGSVPIAWYHTHPFVSNSQGMAYASKEFIDGDKAISDSHGICGYVGVYDGTFWRYDPAPVSRDNSATDADGNVVPEREGRFIQLADALKTPTL